MGCHIHTAVFTNSRPLPIGGKQATPAGNAQARSPPTRNADDAQSPAEASLAVVCEDVDDVEILHERDASAEGLDAAATGAGIAPRGKAILVNHGSFNPVHRGHIQMMIIARRRLESEGYNVIAAHLGITGPAHIREKGARAMQNALRVQCIDLLAAEMGETWIRGDARGIEYESGGKMAGVIRKEQKDVTVFNVRGADLAEKYGVKYGAPTVWVGRTGSDLPGEGIGPCFCIQADAETGDFSSTRLREALKARDVESLETISGKAVARLLLERRSNLWT